MVFSIISKSQLESANRIDAEYFCGLVYFQNDYLLGSEIIDFTQYGTSEDLNEENIGFPVLRLNEINNVFIDKPSKYCNKITKQTFEKLKLNKGDVLICRTNGNPKLVGKSGIVMENMDIAFASYLYRIKPKEELINSATLVTYLNSQIGRSEIEKNMMISNQTNFSPAKFREIKIPKVNINIQNLINDLVNTSYQQNSLSEKLYMQAENLLLEELGLKNYKIEDDLSFIVNFSDVKSSNRIDPDYFQQKYQKLISKLQNQRSKPLSEVIDNVAAKFSPLLTPEKTFRYIELANINSSLGIIDGASEVLGIEAPSRARRVLKERDVIVSSIGGSLNKVALVDKENEGSLASTGFFQFRSKEILPEVLLVLAKSVVLQMQLEKQVAGTILAAISNESLKNIVIPILPMGTQQKIADLVRQSHEARKKSKDLLEEAKRKVEEMIEKGGDN